MRYFRKSSGGLSGGLIAVIVIACVVVLALIAGLIAFIRKRNSKQAIATTTMNSTTVKL